MKHHVTVFNPGMMLRFGGHVWIDVHPPLTMGGWGDNAPVVAFENPSVWAVEGNGIKPSHLGVGISDENAPMYTLNTTEVHAVMIEEDDVDRQTTEHGD